MLVELIWSEDPVKVDSEKWWPEGKVPKYRMLDVFRTWIGDTTAHHACIRVYTQSEYVLDCFRLLHILGECELVIYVVGETMVKVGKYGAIDNTFYEREVTTHSSLNDHILEACSDALRRDGYYDDIEDDSIGMYMKEEDRDD